MKVYLVQHGESKSEMEDPEWSLMKKGKEVVESMADYVSPLGAEVAQVLHSGRLWPSRQPKFLASTFRPLRGIREEKWLGALDDPQKAKRLTQQAERSLMIVGNLLHLSRVASSFILGMPETKIIRFKMGGVPPLARAITNDL